jgi:hypothetical protein
MQLYDTLKCELMCIKICIIIVTINIFGMTALYGPYASYFGFPDNRIFTWYGCQPHAQPPTQRTRPSYL